MEICADQQENEVSDIQENIDATIQSEDNEHKMNKHDLINYRLYTLY